MARLSLSAERVAVEEGIPYDSLSSRVGIGIRIDTTGMVSDYRMLDNTCRGDDSCSLAPATPASRRLMQRVFARLEGAWSPAMADGRPIPYNLRMTVRIPVEKIERAQNPDPLLFLGEYPRESFYKWAYVRLRYDERYSGCKGGINRVSFYIEPDGSITLGEVLQSTNDKLVKEMIRIIRKSKGKWTPRKVRGVAQRTQYVYSLNFL